MKLISAGLPSRSTHAVISLIVSAYFSKDSDPKMAWKLCDPIRAGEIVVFDKAYVDFEHLCHLHRKGVVWVTRSNRKHVL